LTFSDLLTGLSACEPHTPHGDQAGEARCRIIFRYYSRGQAGRLTFNEFCAIVRDIRVAKGLSADSKDVEAEAAISAKYENLIKAKAKPLDRVFGCEENDSLSLYDFLTGVGQLKFRGPSLLLRSPASFFAILRGTSNGKDSSVKSPVRKRSRKHQRNKQERRQAELSFEVSDDDEDIHLQSEESVDANSGNQTKLDDYDFATHVVKVKRSGQVVDVSSLWDSDSKPVYKPVLVFILILNSSRSRLAVVHHASQPAFGFRPPSVHSRL